jgi:O-antigen ligase
MRNVTQSQHSRVDLAATAQCCDGVPARLLPGHRELPLTDTVARSALHPLEVALVGVTATHLCFLPWALGTVHGWSQVSSLGFALIGFSLAAWPRGSEADSDGTARLRRRTFSALLRRPWFWCGALFLCYIAAQGLNPAWRFFSNASSWWLEAVPSVRWLPSGVDAPFDRSNPWRVLAVFGSLFLVVTSLWMGFRRRKSYHTLFAVLVANAAVLALFGMVERLSGTRRIFGWYEPSNRLFASTFIYPNHAGSYFNLMTALAAGLAWWHYQRSSKEGPGQVGATLGAFAAIACSSGVILSNSRASILLLAGFTLFLGATLLLRLSRRTGRFRHRREFIPITLVLALATGIGLLPLVSEKIRARFAELGVDGNPAVLGRALAGAAALDMARDYWVAGWGAGCFQYGFSKYAKKYPTIDTFEDGRRRTWEHAHNDFLEFLCEFGIAGLFPLVILSGILGGRLWHLRCWRNPVALSIAAAGGLALLHAWVDFIFQNPAVLITLAVLLAAALRWIELDQPGGRQLSIRGT